MAKKNGSKSAQKQGKAEQADLSSAMAQGARPKADEFDIEALTATADAQSADPFVRAKEALEERLGLNDIWSNAQTFRAVREEESRTRRRGLANIRGLDVGLKFSDHAPTGELAVRVFVERKASPDDVDQGLIEPEVDGCPTDVIEVDRVTAFGTLDPRDRERPAPCGSSVGHVDVTAGTIACLCISKRNNLCFLSNNHVLANANNARKGDDIVQPGSVDGGRLPDDLVAFLEDFIELKEWGKSKVDAAIAFTAHRAVSARHQPFRINARTLVGRRFMSVKKYGRTTGFTFGTITGTNASVRVTYEPSGRSSFDSSFTGQLSIQSTSGGFRPFSEPGDSGSLIVEAMSERPVGLLFAGSERAGITYANPIDDVVRELDITLTNDDEA
jgi:hypothetical protein